MSENPENEGWIPSELRALESRLTAAEQARAAETEELLTRMGAVEVLIDHLDARVTAVALESEQGGRVREREREDIELRIGGLEAAADALGPLTSVPATVAALERELIALGERLDAGAETEQLRGELTSREIEARVSVAESNLGVKHGEAWEGMQEAVSSSERRMIGGQGALEQRLAEQAAAATEALAELEERLTTSLESLAGRLGATTGASGAMAESMVNRLETLEREIVGIESQFDEIADRIAARAAAGSPPPADPIEDVEARSQAASKPDFVPPRPAAATPPEPSAVAAADAAETTSGPINLNQASFEVLRSLGCSVTQTARILAARKVRGGFGSPDELGDVPGLPAEFRAELISRLTV